MRLRVIPTLPVFGDPFKNICIYIHAKSGLLAQLASLTNIHWHLAPQNEYFSDMNNGVFHFGSITHMSNSGFSQMTSTLNCSLTLPHLFEYHVLKDVVSHRVLTCVLSIKHEIR